MSGTCSTVIAEGSSVCLVVAPVTTGLLVLVFVDRSLQRTVRAGMEDGNEDECERVPLCMVYNGRCRSRLPERVC